MTSFDDLIGPEATGAERERLRSVHELLLEAGPPPELTPELEAGPTLGMTLGRVRSMATHRRRRVFIPATVAAALVAAVLGYSLSGQSKGFAVIPLHGTANAPSAVGTLQVLTATNGRQPMVVNVHGLTRGTYAVYLVRPDRSWEKCGTFNVTTPAAERPTTIDSPYRAKAGDTWLVTRLTGATGHGKTVLTPTA